MLRGEQFPEELRAGGQIGLYGISLVEAKEEELHRGAVPRDRMRRPQQVEGVGPAQVRAGDLHQEQLSPKVRMVSAGRGHAREELRGVYTGMKCRDALACNAEHLPVRRSAHAASEREEGALSGFSSHGA